ncbi:MAG: phosphoenolpyruvate--protein phosphotransferase [Ignavibacteria bacterium]|nr:phosphoenolpyruvate--protein phosphotransferase [Ignavibacteria bacterium]
MKRFRELLKKSDNYIAGIPAAPGLVIGHAHLFTKEILSVTDAAADDVEAAVVSFHEAVAKAKKELNKILNYAKAKMGEERSEIFSAQLMILDDEILLGNIEQHIVQEKKQPEFIVHREMNVFLDMMRHSSDTYFRERANDIEDIKNRIIRNLQKKRLQSQVTPGVIIVSESLTPADTLLLSKWDIKGYVTDRGGLTSHAAILARSLDIPAVVGTHNCTHRINQDDLLIIDGFHGYVFVNPTEPQLAFFNEKIEKMREINQELKELKDKPSQTTDGHEIDIFANVDVTGEIDLVIANNAKGIGLFRTEQIIEEFGELPDEELQKQIYYNLSTRVYPRSVTIRAFDIGGDKVKIIDYPEANPFLGSRGIRFLLDNPLIFKTQIRALLRANIHNNIHFMIPMVSTVDEVKKTKQLIKECIHELQEKNQEYKKLTKLGIMIEVPSAAVMARQFAREVDFFSIGTNDLIQYIMAVDRGNDAVSGLYQEFNPAVLNTLKHIINAANEAGIQISMCGEMAADNQALPILIGLGLKSISASPSAIHSLKRTIRAVPYEKAVELAQKALELSSQEEVQHLLLQFFEEHNIPRTRTILKFI